MSLASVFGTKIYTNFDSGIRIQLRLCNSDFTCISYLYDMNNSIVDGMEFRWTEFSLYGDFVKETILLYIMNRYNIKFSRVSGHICEFDAFIQFTIWLHCFKYRNL